VDLDGCLSDVAPATDHLVGVSFDKTIEDLDFLQSGEMRARDKNASPCTQ
jgi:hypothetical protein